MKKFKIIIIIVATLSLFLFTNNFSTGAALDPFDFTIKSSKSTIVPGDSLTYEISPLTFDGAGGEKAKAIQLHVTTETVDSSLVMTSIDLPKTVFTIDGKEYGVGYGFYSVRGTHSQTLFIMQPDDPSDYITITRDDIEYQEGGFIPNLWILYVRPITADGDWLSLDNAYYEKLEMQKPLRVNFDVVPDSTDRMFPTLYYPYFYVQQIVELETATDITRNRFGYSFFATYDISAEIEDKYLDPGEDTTISYTITNTGPYPISRLQLDVTSDFEITDTSWVQGEGGMYSKLLKGEDNKFIVIKKGETYKFDLPVKQKEGAVSGDVLNTQMYLYTAGTENLKNRFSDIDFVVSEYYDLVYDGNGATAGTVPLGETDKRVDSPVTIADNTGELVVDGKVFVGWNTKKDASGKTFLSGDIATIKDLAGISASSGGGSLYSDNKIVLYAVWKDKTVTTVTTNTSLTSISTEPTNTSAVQSATVSVPSTGENLANILLPILICGFAIFVVLFTRKKRMNNKL